MAFTVRVPLPTRRIPIAISQFCDVMTVSPRKPPCRSTVAKSTPSIASCHGESGDGGEGLRRGVDAAAAEHDHDESNGQRSHLNPIRTAAGPRR